MILCALLGMMMFFGGILTAYDRPTRVGIAVGACLMVLGVAMMFYAI